MQRFAAISVFLVLTAHWLCVSNCAWTAEQVGVLGDPSKIVVEGVTSFPLSQVHQTLRRNPDVQYAGHRTAPMSGFLQSVQKSLVSSFQRSGFDQVQVAARVDRKNRVIVVRVEEGPRMQCGPIQIRGLDEDDAQTLRSVLLNTRKQALPRLTLASEKSADESKRNGPASAAKDSDQKTIRWEPGQFLKFDDSFLESASAAIARTLQSVGRVGADFSVQLERNEAEHQVSLAITFRDAGRVLHVDEIQVNGVEKNSPEDLLTLLELKTGQRLTGALIQEIETKLRTSARFWKRDVVVDWDAERGRTTLTLNLVEHPSAPPLGQPFNEQQAALLKVAHWLDEYGDREDGFRACVEIAPAGSEVRGKADIISVDGNMQGFLDVEIGNYPRKYAVVATKDGVGVLNIQRARKLLVPPWKSTLKLTLRLVPDYSKQDTSSISIKIDAGISSQTSERGPGVVNFQIDPVVVIQVAAEQVKQWNPVGDIVDCETSRCTLRFNSKTGAVLEIREVAADGSAKVGFTFGKGAEFAEENRLIETKLRSEGTNVYDSDAGFVSFAAFVLGELLWNSGQHDSEEEVLRERADRVAELCFRFSSMVLQCGEKAESKAALAAPEVSFAGELNWTLAMKWTKLLPIIATRYADELFPRDSWPWVICREIGFMAHGRTDYLKEEIVWLLEDAEMGPVGCACAAYFVKLLKQPALAQKFAKMGMDRLREDLFIADIKLLVEGEHLTARVARGVFEVVRGLRREELTAVVNQFQPQFVQPAVFIHDRVAADGRDIERVMLSFARSNWQPLAKDYLERVLTSRTFFPAGFRRDSPFQPKLGSD